MNLKLLQNFKQMKKLLLLVFLFLSGSIFAQKYYTKTGRTEFKASVEAFEPVGANNNSTTALIDIKTGNIASLLFIKAFNFRVALMQEHFYENYMESNKFPKATFKGKIVGFNFSEISGSKEYTIKGTLTVRGVTKEIETLGTFTIQGEKLLMKASFGVKPEDFLDYEFIEKK